jgi:cupin superfamily acireductone dioxygenase involved in methionine salvage
MENDIYEDISLEKEKAKLETENDEIMEKDNNIDAIFESSQKAFMIKKGNTKDENINKYLIMETVMPIIQRYGIYQDIIMEISKIENIIKEFESLQQSQKEITADKIELEKELIVISVIK